MAPTSVSSLSAMPTGPLAMMLLYLTEGDVGQLVRTQLEMHARQRAGEVTSDEFWRFRCCSTFGWHVDCIQDLGKDAFQAFLAAKAKRRCLPSPVTSGTSQSPSPSPSPSPSTAQSHQGGQFNRLKCSDQLLTKSLGASSQDMDVETPAHTLLPSPCSMTAGEWGALEGTLRQTECGCAFWAKCYWSSQPSPVADKDEWLEYDMVDSPAVVSSFVLTPYKSFWQPDQPTYNPVEACFQLTHPLIKGGEKPYYESPRFRVDASMKRQQFDLPQPVLSLGGRAKVLLLGMAQRQTLPETVGETANHYHVCISYAALMGTVLLSCHLAGGAAADEGNDGGSGSGSSNETGEGAGVGGAAGRSAVQVPGVPAEGGGGEIERWVQAQEKEQRDLRLRWVVEVFVHPMDPRDESSGQTAGTGEGGGEGEGEEEEEGEATCDAPRRPFKVLAFGDTPCLQFVERYAQLVAPMRPEDVDVHADVGLMLTADSGGGALPVGEGVNLGGVAVEGRLDLVDPALHRSAVWG